jgi:hypothetical protein
MTDTFEINNDTFEINNVNDDNVGINKTMLTTLDNPFNPFTQFDEWFAFDTEKGYNSCNYLARIARVSDDLSEADESSAIEEAIDEIVEMNITGLYIKVTPESWENRSKYVST